MYVFIYMMTCGSSPQWASLFYIYFLSTDLLHPVLTEVKLFSELCVFMRQSTLAHPLRLKPQVSVFEQFCSPWAPKHTISRDLCNIQYFIKDEHASQLWPIFYAAVSRSLSLCVFLLDREQLKAVCYSLLLASCQF